MIEHGGAMLDALIVGGGPAGLRAALVLGRCRRSVAVFDHGRYRNARARAVNGFLTRDGASPAELRQIAHAELLRYPSIQRRPHEVLAARRVAGGFEVSTADGNVARGRKLLVATGALDRVPAVQGLEERVGATVFHCPYCDGWEVRDQPLLAYAHGDEGARFALGLTVWSARVLLCTDGGPLPSASMRGKLDRLDLGLCTQPIERLDGDDVSLEVRFRDGSTRAARALFYSVGCQPGAALASQLGAEANRAGSIVTDRDGATRIPGLYVAGDATRDALQVIVAAGEGSAAALAINRALTSEDLGD